jgi:hypothetical protein
MRACQWHEETCLCVHIHGVTGTPTKEFLPKSWDLHYDVYGMGPAVSPLLKSQCVFMHAIQRLSLLYLQQCQNHSWLKKLYRRPTLCQSSPGREAVRLAGMRVVQQGKFCQSQARVRHYVRQMKVNPALLAPAHLTPILLKEISLPSPIPPPSGYPLQRN